jgi:TPR repeat protein
MIGASFRQAIIVLGVAANIVLVSLPGTAQTMSPNTSNDDHLQEKAAAGDAAAQYELGLRLTGDHAKAFRWFRQAAERGHAHAQYLLGLSYNSGTDVPQNYAEALRWFRKAAARRGTPMANFPWG